MSRAPQRAPLTRDRVVRAGVALADDNGIEAVSMRRLAKDLGVEVIVAPLPGREVPATTMARPRPSQAFQTVFRVSM